MTLSSLETAALYREAWTLNLKMCADLRLNYFKLSGAAHIEAWKSYPYTFSECLASLSFLTCCR